MRRNIRRLTLVLLSIAALLVLAAAVGVWYVGIRPLPTTRGDLNLPGLQAPVTVYRDSWGIPHIFAQNTDDLFMAQGYVQAGDRLWQMEFQRRTGHGRLSEILGDATLSTDRFLRTLGTTQAAQADLEIMDPQTRSYLDAYARGVNAYIEQQRGNLPIEFRLLGVKPEPWTPVDSLVWGKMIAWDLGGNWETELLRARIVAVLGAAAAQQLLPNYPASDPLIIPSEVHAYRDLGTPDVATAAADVNRWLSPVKEGIGSNNWVVGGEKTASGKPLLANDPHLGIRLPSIWWEVGLHGGGYNVVGAGMAGVPGVIIGHNDRIAWGVTNAGPDVQDLYLEHVRGLATDTPEVEYQGQWYPATVRYETIKVKGKPDESLRIVRTRHGPLLNYVVSGLDQPVAFKWTATSEPNELFRAFVQLDRAQNFQDFRDALRYFAAPAQNVVYADVDGNIGYQMPGRIPRRAQGQGLVPAPGWTGEYEWIGNIPFDELPTMYNPPAHFIATANNKIISDDYPYFISAEWAAPYRARRITDVLSQGSSFTAAEMQTLQADTQQLFSQKLQAYVSQVQPQGWLQEEALKTVRAWDGHNDIDSAGAAILEVAYKELLQRILADELPKSLYQDYLTEGNMHRMMVDALLDDANSVWWDNKQTPQRETRDDLIAQSFAAAVDWLGRQYGDVPAEWKWGRLHTATFQHTPLGQSGIAPLEQWLNRGPIRARGGLSVNAAGYNYQKPYAVSSLASYRQVIDLGNLAASQSMHTTGQSGQPFSRYYDNMIQPWQRVEYHPMPFDAATLQADGAERLTLTP